MKKISKIIAILTLLVLLIAAATLVACNNDDKQTDNGKDKPVTVKLFVNDGTNNYTTQKISPNGLGDIEDPTRAGYTFDGWAFDEAGTRMVPDGYTLTKDASLYAQWTICVYTVAFKVNGKTVREVADVAYHEAATAPAVTDFWQEIPEGQAFDGWDTSEFGSVERDLVVNAKLTNADFTVQFKARDVLVARFGGKSGAIVPSPALPEIEGYNCTGWKGFAVGETTFTADAVYAADLSFEEPETIDLFAGDAKLDGAFTFALNDATPTLRAAVAQAIDGITYDFEWNINSKTYSDATVTPDAFAVSGDYDCSVTCTLSDDFGTENIAKTTAFRLTVTKEDAHISTSADVIERDWTGSAFGNFVDEIGASIGVIDDGGSWTYTLSGEAFGNEITLTDGGVYPVIVRYESPRYAGEKTVTIKIKAASVNGVTYTLEDALALGGDIVLFGNAILSGEHTLGSGSTLILPYDGSGDMNKVLSADGGKELFYVDVEKESEYLKRSLTVTGKLSVVGTLKIGGVIGHKDMNAFQGATLGEYAQLNVAENAILSVEKDGAVFAHGFIKGAGDAIVNVGGTLTTHFVVRDFRGGTNTAGIYFQEHICPFNQYELPNVQTWLTVYAGGKVNAQAQLFANSSFNNAESTLISYGTETGLIQLQNGYVKAKYTSDFEGSKGSGSITGGADVAAQLAERFPCSTKLEIHGDASIGSLKLSVQGMEVSTSGVLLPLSYAYDVTIASGTTSLKYGFKLLPGAKLTVAKGATLELNKTTTTTPTLIVYEATDWKDSTEAGYFVYAQGKPAAKFVVNGTFNALSGSAFGGKIYSEANGAKVNFASNVTLSATSKEGWARAMFNNSTVTYTETRDAELVGANATVKAEARSYTYNGTAWA